MLCIFLKETIFLKFSIKHISLFLLLILFLPTFETDFLNVACEKCNDDSFRQFPSLKGIEAEDCNICTIENTSSVYFKDCLNEGRDTILLSAKEI